MIIMFNYNIIDKQEK